MCAQARLERDEGPAIRGPLPEATHAAQAARATLSAPCASRFAVSIEGHFPEHAATFLPMLRDQLGRAPDHNRSTIGSWAAHVTTGSPPVVGASRGWNVVSWSDPDHH